ncbi:MAG: DUF1206 domain-containing protein [Sideroxydans sp.]|nr:DUF1206 domain-containing protein [Sideroxydans sp.]
MSNRTCPKCGKSAYGFPKCPWCSSMYFQNESLVTKDEVEEVRVDRQTRGFWFYVALLILIFGPIVLGVLGAGLMMLNDALGFSPVSQHGLIAAMLWMPMGSFVTWLIAAVLIVVALGWAILKGIFKSRS